MNLTNEEIFAIAYRLDEIIGDHFHDAIYDIYLLREHPHPDEEVSDEDIQKIKTQKQNLHSHTDASI